MASDQSDEDNIVLDTTRRIFADLADPQTPVAVDGGWKKALWPALEEAGLTLAWASEDSGGVGASLRDGFSILRINGQYAAPAPLAETLLAAWALSQAGLSCPSGPMTSAMLRPSDTLTLGADGRISGRLSAIPFANDAENLVAYARDADGASHVVLLPLGAATRSDRGVDLGASRMDLAFDSVEPVQSARADDTSDHAAFERIGAVSRVQEMSGALETMLKDSADYVQERIAFGRPIGKFQAVQQNLARLGGEVAAAVTAASSSADTIANVLESSDSGVTDEDLFLEVSSAKIRAGEAANEGAAIAHQAHGAIGFTSEYRLQNYTRALWRWRDDFGAEAHWALRLGERVAAAGPDALWPQLTRR